MENWIEIFKTGIHTDASGHTQEFTLDDLNTIANSYNSQTEHTAPVVIGHPVTNSPAYGWVDKLKVENNSLYASFKELNPDFVEMVKQGSYKKISIALYSDLLLRHVGFLGGVPPAIKGMKEPIFNNNIDFKTFSFNELIVTSENNLQENNLINIPKGKTSMNLDDFISEILKFITENFSAEVAGQVSGEIEKLKPKIELKPPASPATPPTVASETTNASQIKEEFAENKEVVEMKKQISEMKYRELMTELKHQGYITEPIAQVFNEVFSTGFEFSELNSNLEKIKKLANAYGKVIEFKELPKPHDYSTMPNNYEAIQEHVKSLKLN